MPRPPISEQQYHARVCEFGKRLIDLGELDFDMLNAFLNIFDGNTLRRFATTFSNSHRLRNLLDSLPNGVLVDNCLLLAKKGWFASAASAKDILHVHIQGHFVSPTNRNISTHESSAANQIYYNDPIRIEEGNWEVHMRQLIIVLQNYDSASQTPAFFFPKLFPHYISLEGDVSTFCLVQVIYPVLTVLNAVLHHRKFPCRLSVRSQATTENSARIYIDHLIMFHANSSDRKGTALVIHEEKVYGSMADWKKWIEKEYGYVVATAPGYTKLKKMISQIRKYVFECETVYTMMSDAERHVGGVWDACSDWTSGKRGGAGFAGRYGASEHVRGKGHACFVIMGYNEPQRNELTGREVLALLCHMALRDQQIILLPK